MPSDSFYQNFRMSKMKARMATPKKAEPNSKRSKILSSLMNINDMVRLPRTQNGGAISRQKEGSKLCSPEFGVTAKDTIDA
jgi:hypothetical protein